MKFAFALLPIVAALGFVGASPVADQVLAKRFPVPVTKFVCDGDTGKCTAGSHWGDGRYVAQWSASVFHQDLFGELTEEKIISMAPVVVTGVVCDGNAYTCTARLHYGDGRWVARWSTSVFHQGLFTQEAIIGAMAPVPVTMLACDGNANNCAAHLDFGDGNWVAQWDADVFPA